MMDKHALFRADHVEVQSIFGTASAGFEKTAREVLPEVARYIASLTPRPDCQYVLVNALGAGERYGSNSNGDYFPEAALTNAPADWTGTPVFDIPRAKGWPYGYPTFYEAKAFAHHKNTDPTRGFGDVELAAWNPVMKRVELVIRLDKDKCQKFGGEKFWQRILAGEHPDVSMGCRVPYDTCSICLDHARYAAALATFDPKRHKHPGEAVLEVHKKNPIRGVAITRKDYCEHARRMMNKTLPDGRKVYVVNDFPKFFDISFVFIGADKTAKVMLKIASYDSDDGPPIWVPAASTVRERLSIFFTKTAAMMEETAHVQAERAGEPTVTESILHDAVLRHGMQMSDSERKKVARIKKRGEIDKDLPPISKAIPLMTRAEPDLPRDLQDALSKRPLNDVLETTGRMGIILRPREFQRIVLKIDGSHEVADRLHDAGITFPAVEDACFDRVRGGQFDSDIAGLCVPHLRDRCCFSPAIEKRVVIIMFAPPPGKPDDQKRAAASLTFAPLHKIAALYNGYRQLHMIKSTRAQDILSRSGFGQKIASLVHGTTDRYVSPYTEHYVRHAFFEERAGDEAGGRGRKPA